MLLIPTKPDTKQADTELAAWQKRAEGAFGLTLPIEGDDTKIKEELAALDGAIAPLIVPIEADTEAAKKSVTEWVQQSKEELELEAQVQVDTKPAEAGLSAVAEAANRAAVAAEGIKLDVVMSRAIGAIGPVKDILQKAGGEMLGFSEDTVKAIGTVGDLAEKGAQLGAVLGPWGALAGAATGAVIGYFTAASVQAKKAEADFKAAQVELEDIQKTAKEAITEFGNLGEVNLSSVIEQVKELDRRIKEAKGGSKETQDAIVELGEKGVSALGAQLTALGREARGLGKIDVEGMGFYELDNALRRSKAQLESVAQQSDVLADKALNQGIAWYATAEGLESANADLKSLKKQQQEAKEEVAAYTAAIEALNPPLEKNTEATQANTRAVVSNHDALVARNKDLLDYIDTVVAARKELAALNDEVIASMEADAPKTAPEPDAVESLFGKAGDYDLEQGSKDADARIAQQAKLDDSLLTATQQATELRAQEEQDSLDASAARYEGYFSVVGGFLGGFTAQLEDNVAQGRGAFDRMGIAAEKGVAQVLKALGKKWAAEATAHAAQGVAYAFTPGAQGLAAGQFVSAAGFAAAAAAAGVAGAVVGGSASAAESAANEKESEQKSAADKGASGAGSSGASSGGGASSPATPGPTTLPPVIVEFGGAVAEAKSLERSATIEATLSLDDQDVTDSIARIQNAVSGLDLSASLTLHTDEAMRTLADWHRQAREEISVAPVTQSAPYQSPTARDTGPSVINHYTNQFNGPILSSGEDAKAQIGRYVKEALDAHNNAGPDLSRRS
jgi:hypothetical protein